MLKDEEVKILKLIKLLPIFVMILFFIVLYLMLQNNNRVFEDETKHIEMHILTEQKEKIKREVERVHSFIVNKRALNEEKIKKNVKEFVDLAHSIASSIYEKNKSKSEVEIKKLIKDALREIRFNDNRGYFFIYDLKGTNVLHPILPHLEDKNLINFQDKKGVFVIQKTIDIVKSQSEGFLSWRWVKPKNKNKEFDKIGFVKHFQPYDWYIGTGEYIADYEAVLKKDLLKQIIQVRYDKNGYVFVIDYEGTYRAHVKESNIGKNRINLQDKNGLYLMKEIINTAKKGGGYLSYVGTIKPSTGLQAEKTSYIIGIDDWGWSIGSGVYISDIEERAVGERLLLNKKNKAQITNIIIVSLVTFVILLILTFYFSNVIEKRFKRYGQNVQSKNDELNDLNLNLENIVKERTKKLNKINTELEETIANLQETKKDLISSQKMATLGDLVSSISHELNTPIGLSITATSHLDSLRKKLVKEYENESMTEEYFMDFIKSIDELTKMLTINLTNTKNLIHGFHSVAVDQAIEDKREIDLRDYINDILLTLKNKTEKKNIKITIDSPTKIVLNTYPGFISQILINLINNSMFHGFKDNKEGNISIIVKETDNNVEIRYLDDGEGIKEEIIDKVFEQYYTTKKHAGGTGLGLYIIKKIIIDKLQGSIEIEKGKDKGVCFIVNLPKKLEN